MFKGLAKFWKRNQCEILMYGHVNALCSHFPLMNASVEKVIQDFYKTYDISEDEWPLQSARATYYRMQREYFNTKRTTNGETTE